MTTVAFFTVVRSGARVMVGDAVRIERATCTSNPHQPASKWYVTARPKNPAAYAAKKVATGEWAAA